MAKVKILIERGKGWIVLPAGTTREAVHLLSVKRKVSRKGAKEISWANDR